MKIRKSFISNSSTASFIVAFDENKNACPTCKRLNIDIEAILEKLANTSYDDSYKIKAKGYECVFNYIVDNYYDCEHKTDLLKKLKQYKTGYQILMFDTNMHDNTIDIILNGMDCVILEKEQG